jgi:hypothetical protein
MIAVTYGLARFAYGLFLPEMREALDLSETVLDLIGAGSYAGYCFAILIALLFTSRTRPRFMAVDDHQVLGPVLLARQQPRGQGAVLVRRCPAGAGPLDGPGLDPSPI